MFQKFLVFCLIVYSEAQTLQQFKANGQGNVNGAAFGGAGGGGAGGPWVFDLPPLNLQPLQLRLNPSTTPSDSPALFLIRQNESIPVTSQETNTLQNWSQLPQTAQQWNPQWTQLATPQWNQPLQTFGVQSPQTPLPPPQTQLQTPQIQSLQPVDQTKPLMPLAFQPFGQNVQVSIPSPLLGLSVNGVPKQNPLSSPLQPINPSFVQNWQTQQQVTASTTPAWAQNLQIQSQTPTPTSKSQLTQTFTNFGQKPLTSLSQPFTYQQNFQTLKRNDIPNTSAYELTDITPVLQSLAAYTPQPPQLSSQSQQFNQLSTQSVNGQQIAPQLTNANTKYFPSVTLPAVNLPSNELPVKLIDLSQFNQLTGLQKNPDRSTWSSTKREKGEAATLIPQTLTAPKPLSAFNSLQTNVWSKPSPLNSFLAKTQSNPQTFNVPKASPVVQQLPTVADALTASVQSWVQSSQQPGPSPTNPVPPITIPSPLLGLSAKQNQFQPLATPLQPLTAPLQPLAAPLQPWSGHLQPLANPVQLSAPIKPLSLSSPVSALPLQSIPLTVSKSAHFESWPTGITQQYSPLKPLSSFTPINPLPIGGISPLQPLSVQPLPALKPIAAATSLKSWSSMAPNSPLPQPQPLSLTVANSGSLQSWPTTINQQLLPLKPLSAVTPFNPLPVGAVAPPKPLGFAQPWLSHKPQPISTASLQSWSSFAPSKTLAKPLPLS